MDDLFSQADLDQEVLAAEAAAKAASAAKTKVEEPVDQRAALNGRRLFIVDGYSLIYRSYFAFLSHPLTDADGNNISAFFGFFNTVLMLLRDYGFDYFAIALDSKGPTFRHLMYPEYKANRDSAPQDLHSQVPMITDALKEMNIPFIAKEGYEADDLIATLASNASRLGIETVMVTGDKDLLQLVDDRVKALRPPKKGQPKYELFGPDEVRAEFGIRPDQIVDYLSLLGDSSDNVPGVKGIGEKGAVKLLVEYESLDGIYRHLDSLAKGTRQKLEDGRDSAYLSQSLVELKDDVFTLDSFDSPAYKIDTIDYVKAGEIFKQRGCTSLARTANALSGHKDKVDMAPPAGEGGEDDTYSKDVTKDQSLLGVGTYRPVLDIKEVRARFEEAARGGGRIAFDLETDSLDPLNARIVGFSFCYKLLEAWYCPLIAEGRTYIALADVIQLFKDYFRTGRLAVIGQNLKFDLEILRRHGVGDVVIEGDTMVEAWLCDSEASSFSLEALSLRYLAYEALPYDEIVPKGKDFSAVALDDAVRYSGEDSDLAWRLHIHLSALMEEQGLTRIWLEYERPLIPVLVEMELNGVLLDKSFMKELDASFSARQEALEAQIKALAGHDFNLNSPQQLGNVLFDELGLKAGRKTQRGWSTATEVLEELRDDHPIIALILEYRSVSKLLGTYVDTLPLLAAGDGRIHTSFLQTGTATGRLSSKNPNLQNIPIRSEDGRLIRRAFTAPEGSLFLSADYSQVELVMLAHVSRDEALSRAFTEGMDVHRYTAGLIFDKDADDVDAQERRIAKTINFGIMYGMSAFRLSNELSISRADAKDFIERYFRRYSGVRKYVDDVVKQAERDGFVRTVGGHKRTVMGINSRNKSVKAAAERVAVNTVIQGSAAELMKKAMAAVYGQLKERGLSARLLLQVHDELILEVPGSELEEVSGLVKDCMESVARLSVPLHVSMESAKRWGDMH